jgi:phosphoribosylaminoimidazolecarboxamide formyltransferase/IMP cyclohydrolase
MRAIIAVYDKTDIGEFAGSLVELGFEIYSTGGTHKAITESGVAVQQIADLTGFPEMLDGRVKTLHPKVHGGILARRDSADHMGQLREREIEPIDLVCVNLYPFQQTVAKPDVTEDDALENIDIGGPTMIRAAAKNYPSVLVLVDPGDYDEVLDSLRAEKIPLEFRRRLAQKAFQHVASYDTAIAGFLRDEEGFPLRGEPASEGVDLPGIETGRATRGDRCRASARARYVVPQLLRRRRCLEGGP